MSFLCVHRDLGDGLRGDGEPIFVNTAHVRAVFVDHIERGPTFVVLDITCIVLDGWERLYVEEPFSVVSEMLK